MTSNWHKAIAVGSVCLFAGATSFAQTPTATRVYKLAADSTYQHGCFPPCLCPILDEQPLRGTFRLTPTVVDPLYQYYAVSEVNWLVTFGSTIRRITGAGTYRIGGEFALLEQLDLDLLVDGQPLEHFTSGLVVGGSEFPRIDIQISINGVFCLDTVIRVDASPAVASDFRPYRLVAGSTFQEGCWDPCDCPLGPEMPMGGSFTLMPIGATAEFQDFAVLNLNFNVAAPAPSLVRRVRGYGVFRASGAALAGPQQMNLDLLVGADPSVRYDSSLAGGAHFPAIDVLVSMHGLVCYDRALDIHASPWVLPSIVPSILP